MPIYAYRCSNCGHAQDVLQKISDPLLTVCPACGEPSYVKQVTAAGFQLKGSGWYVTDFRGDNKPAKPAAGDAAKSSDKANGEGAAKAETTSGDSANKTDTVAAPAPAPAAAPPASTAAPPASGKTGS